MKEIVPTRLPPNWQRVPLESVVIRMSNGITKRQTKDGQGFAVSRIETISQGVVDFSRVGYLSNLSPSEVEKYRLHGGDILFSHINSDLHLGKTAVVSTNTDPLIHGMNLLLIRVDQKKAVPVFLHWLFNYYRVAGFFMSIAQHAVNQSSINQGKLKNLPVILPPFEEQREIVAEIEKQFTRLEAGVAGLRRVQASLKRYRAAVLKGACEGKLVPTEAELARQEGRAYETGAQLLERILTERRQKWNGRGKYREPVKADTRNLPPPPDGWEWGTAEQLTDATRSITYGVIKLGVPVQGGVPILRSSDVRHLKLDLEGVKQISPDIAGQFKRTFLRGGEILVTVRGTLGGVVVAPEVCSGYNISREVAMLALVEPFIAKTVALFIGSANLQRWLLERTKGIAYTGINIETLKQLPIPIPPFVEQRRIVGEVERRLSVVEELEGVVNANLQRVTRLRQSILQRAFEGNVPTKRPRTSTAEELSIGTTMG